jgi:hypothetical protein
MSKIEVDAIDKQSGSTLTLGGSGTAVTLACGATQTGFGRTGTVDWQTSIKTSATFSASNGEGYFVDTSSNAVTANLPAGSAGAIVSFKDYAQNFDTNALTISANGSEKIEGLTEDLILSTEGIATTLVYGDATKGWQSVNSNEIVHAQKFVTATGGTITTVCTNFKVHTFTGPGTFCVSCAGSSTGSNTVDYLVIAGGGGGASGGGSEGGGAGGAGGYRESSGAASGAYSASPLGGCVAALPVSVQSYSIAVGGGGAGGPGSSHPEECGSAGAISTFSTITSAGGGNGGAAGNPPDPKPGGDGGSGGGSGTYFTASGGSGNTPPVSPAQGNNGGTGGPGSPGYAAGGGGGATAVGGNATAPTSGVGGAGATSSINATPTARGGGGGGGSHPAGIASAGGAGGGGAGGDGGTGTNGTANTGGGAGGSGGGTSNAGATGGSGVVIIRYKFQ